MKRCIFVIFIMLPCLGLLCPAQGNDFDSRFEDFRKSVDRRFNSYREQTNNRYADYIRGVWQRYEAKKPHSISEKQPVPPVFFPDDRRDRKPDKKTLPVQGNIPVIETKEHTRPDDILPVHIPTRPVPLSPIKECPDEELPVVFDFYGAKCKIRFPNSKKINLATTDRNEIADAWLVMASNEYNNTILDCLAIRDSLKLTDWHYRKLLIELGRRVYPDPSRANLLVAYVLSQSGYKMRLIKNSDILISAFHSPCRIYGMGYISVRGEDFYSEDIRPGSFEVLDIDFEGERPFDLTIHSLPQLPLDLSDPRLIKSDRYPEMALTVSINKNIIDYYNGYPCWDSGEGENSNWTHYVTVPTDTFTTGPLYRTMRQIIGGMHPLEAAERILNLVQTGFDYRYDSEVWGYERAFFVEETLFYPYCDCEDRAILMSHFIRDLLKLDVALVFYKNHLAMAVAFGEDTAGDYITSPDGRKYTICDPTYINAPIGMSMPGLEITGVWFQH